MYGSIPYMIPNVGMQAAAPLANGLAASSGLNAATNAAGLGTSIFSKINWSSLLSNAQKTLNVVNQAIPLYYQVKPVFKNMKTLSRIGKEFTKLGTNSNANVASPNITSDNEVVSEEKLTETTEDLPNPTFYL